jgi:Bacterial membrane protein YfhO
MNKSILETFKPHLIAIGLFIVLTFAYFMPVLQGKQIEQHDIEQWTGMSKEILDWKAKTGVAPLWTNSMFSGMPGYQISFVSPANLLRYVSDALWLWLPVPASYMFLMFLGFYILMITLKADWRISIAGAFAYSLASYNFIIINAGHNSKAHAIALLPLVIAGVIMTVRGNILRGGILTAVALALQIYANHLQITYYLAFGIIIYMISEAVYAVKDKSLVKYLKSGAVLLVAAFLAILPNITSLWATYEYGQYSTRSQSELKDKKISTGLDKDYAMDWSYGQGETFSLLIPNIRGGAMQSELTKNSATYKALQANGASAQADSFIKNAPMYWGEKTGAPTYLGAIVVFLFVLGIFIVDGRNKWWLIAASVLAILLAWGKNFPDFSDIFFDHFPGYNKFRAVSMTLVLAGFTMPLLAILGFKKMMEVKDPSVYKKQLLWSFYITGGLCLLFGLIPGFAGSFSAAYDENFSKYDWLMTAIREDRMSLLRTDAFRSLFFIAIAFGTIWFYMKGKLKTQVVVLIIAAAILVDEWSVGKRYLNDEKFVAKSKAEKPFEPTVADQQIMTDTSYYRVMNTTVSTFNDASTSYFHKSIGGYHGAKLKRYQELIENQIGRGNMKVLDMLNMKYVIQAGSEGQPLAVPNPGALGNAWFVNEFKIVADADAEMQALNDFNPKTTLIVDKRYEEELKGLMLPPDSLSAITLTSYSPDELKYKYNATSKRLTVFSDIYYPKGWNAYIDGKLSPYFRANYVLRAMVVPEGKHEIVFRFEPEVFVTGEKIALAGSSLLLLLGAVAIFSLFKRKKA